MPGRLEGKVAVVTGAGRGIGEAIARKFALEGARVVVNGLPCDAVAEVAGAITSMGGQAVPFAQEIADEKSAAACVQLAIDSWGQLDILVCNADARLATAEITDYPLAQFDEIITRNIRSVFLMCKYGVPHLQRTAGNIIATGSDAGTLGLAHNTPYGGAKGFIHAFIKGVAVEQAKHGIRANCVSLGPVEVASSDEIDALNAQEERSFLAATPMGRRGTSEEVANVFAFLASDMASYVTGALWSVDGGNIGRLKME